jgi:hypothetical protein
MSTVAAEEERAPMSASGVPVKRAPTLPVQLAHAMRKWAAPSISHEMGRGAAEQGPTVAAGELERRASRSTLSAARRQIAGIEVILRRLGGGAADIEHPGDERYRGHDEQARAVDQ